MTYQQTLPGETLLVRIGYSQRANTPYFPPLDIMEEYRRFSDEHDGHVLYTTGAYGVRAGETAEHVILWTMKHPLKLIAEIHDSGSPYNPATWDRECAYQSPRPWDANPKKKWLALDGLRELDGFDPDMYDAVTSTGDIPLPDALKSMSRLTVLRIVPAAGR